MTKIRIGTRGSALALAQTRLVEEQLRQLWPEAETEIVILHTKGDKILDKPLAQIGDKGLFVTEFEQALLEGSIDLAVHSAKDLPLQLAEGLEILAVPRRADARDVLVQKKGKGSGFEALPEGAVIGTGSLRRQLYVKKNRPDVECRLLRGNVQTRLGRLQEGLYDGIILAAAGLQRLGAGQVRQQENPASSAAFTGQTENGGGDFSFEELFFKEISLSLLEPETFLPAACQGIIAVEGRADWQYREKLKGITHRESWLSFETERQVLHLLGADCSEPAAAYSKIFTQAGQEWMELAVMYGGKEVRGKAPVTERLSLAGELCAAFTEKKAGKVYLVGAGCGGPELITVKGLELLQRCETVLYDSLTDPALLRETPEGCEKINVGKRFGGRAVPQEEINRLLIQKAREGRLTVRLKGGDPYVFGRGGEEMLALSQAGVACEEVPGITSAIAAPAAAGIPVTHRQLSRSFTVLTASSMGKDGEELSGIDYDALARLNGTIVILMGMHHLQKLAEGLMAAGMSPEKPAAVIMEGATDRQKSVRAGLGQIAQAVSQAGLEPPAVIVIGETAGLELPAGKERPVSAGLPGEKACCLGEGSPSPVMEHSLPLSGARIGVTGTPHFAERLKNALERKGAAVADCSFLCAVRTGEKLPELGEFSWLVFTSPNGVIHFMEKMREERRDVRTLAGLKLAAIGPGTARKLEEYGLYACLMPEIYDAAHLGAGLAAAQTGKEKILICRAQEGSPLLTEALEKKGCAYMDFPLYCLKEDEARRRQALQESGRLDYLLFGSASGVRTFMKALEKNEPDERKFPVPGCVGCIGAQCAAALQESRDSATLGTCRMLVAQEYTLEGLVRAVEKDWIKRKEEADRCSDSED